MNFSNSHKQILNFCSYQLLCWLLYLIILSLGTFFHFLLDHRLGVIEDWLFEFGWQLISVSKLLGFLAISSFYMIKFDVGNPLVKIFYEGNRSLDVRLIKIFLFIFISLVLFGGFEKGVTFNIYKVLASYTSSVSFYFFDVIVIILGQKVWPLSLKKQSSLLWPISLIFIGSSLLIFLKEQENSFLFTLHIILLFKFLLGESEGWTNPLAYLLLIVGPITSFLGIDPVWGNDFSLVQTYLGRDNIYLFTIIIISFFFIKIHNKENKNI